MSRDGRSESGAFVHKGAGGRAGRLLLQVRQRADRGGALEALEELGAQPVVDAVDALWWWRGLHARPLSNTAARLRYHVARESGEIRGRVEVTQRLKRLETTVDKLSREQGRITQMHDIGGVRAVLPSLHHVYTIRRRLFKTWTIIRERDYIARPKDSGYRALHLIVRSGTRPIEVQLRTLAQDHWANEVEEQGLKFGGGDAALRAAFRDMAESLAGWDRGEAVAPDLREALESLRFSKRPARPRTNR